MANRGRGKRMRRPVTRLTLLAAAAAMATGCVPVRHNLPPEQRMLEPGPGVGGPGPGVLGPIPSGGMMGGPMMGGGMMGGPMMGGAPGMSMDGMSAQGPMQGMQMQSVPMGPQGMMGPQGAPMGPMAQAGEEGSDIALTNYAGCGPGGMGGSCLGGGSNIPVGGGVLPTMGMMPAVPPTVQVTMSKPEAMQIRYDATGSGMFDSEPLIVPARQNFPQGGLYRLKLTNIANREGVELYPTLELAYANPRTGAYLAHNSIPLQFTEEDFDQVLTGNFVTKVIYLPDPDYQGPALAGIDTLVSTRLDPGIDPITEADRRGSILAIIRLGDKDIEMAGGNDGPGVAGAGMPMGAGFAGLPMPFAPSMTDGCGACGPGGVSGGNGNGNPMPPSLPGMIAGVTAPQYGMPMSGTPIGLPGPPHIPLGHPASLKKHVIKNHTPMHIPQPVDNVKINVRQAPGMSYPNPVSRIHMTEQNVHPGIPQGRPMYDKASQRVQ